MYVSRVEELRQARYELNLEQEDFDPIEYDGLPIRIKIGKDDCAGFDFELLSVAIQRIFGYK